ncbi:ABC transporter substrate-binding protein [Rickettsiales bacterium LUAb2]
MVKNTLIKQMVIIFFITFLCFGTNKVKANNLTKLTLVLDWTPNTNHTGIIVADKLGFYKQQGIELKVVEINKNSGEQLVARGLADFAISSSESTILAVNNGLPIISIAAIIDHTSSGFYSLKNKNITTPKDFENKIYASFGSKVELATLKSVMENVGADYSKVKIITATNFNFFNAKNIDFVWGYEAWTGIEAKVLNIPVNYIPINKYRKVNDYSPVIITNTKFIKDNPQLVEKFIKATLKGYKYSMDNPKKAAQILLNRYPELDKKLIFASQEYIGKQYVTRNKYWGEQKNDVWQQYINWLYENKILDKQLDSNKVFTNKFIAIANKK